MENRPLARLLSHPWLTIGAFSCFIAFVLARAWVAEDAYITFRVVENFWNGYGLRWNIHERVQVYTHPLWLLLQLPLYAIAHNVFLASIALSAACIATALWFTQRTAARVPLVTIGCFLLPLLLSASFMDYTISGLENALSYLLLAVFGYVVLIQHRHPRFWLFFSLTIALALLNRLDMLLLYAPAAIYILYTQRQRVAWRQVALGLSPLLAWFAFSLFYYGFIFPNTKYAKLDTGLALSRYVEQGLDYARHLLVRDAAGALILAIPLAIMLKPAWFRRVALPWPHAVPLLAAGIYAYCAYVVYIGGDYMAGRFWALPIFACVWLAFVSCSLKRRTYMTCCGITVIACAWAAPHFLIDIRERCDECVLPKDRIIDARRIFHKNRLVAKWRPLTLRSEGEYPFARQGRELAKKTSPVIQSSYFIGMVGYHAGPKAIIIDELGLADPLLARLPVNDQRTFYIGHFQRTLPPGYIEVLRTRDMRAMLPPLDRYYEKLQWITSGDLFSPERLKTIVLFNLGAYDRWKEEYIAHVP